MDRFFLAEVRAVADFFRRYIAPCPLPDPPIIDSPAQPPSRSWHILTGEYPPQSGGVADHTHLLATALIEAGDAVHLWIPPGDLPPTPIEGATIHLLADHFGLRSLRRLSRRLRRADPLATVLVQYVPHMYGLRGMNLPLAVWLRWFAPRPRWVLFHEVAFPMTSDHSLKQRFLGLIQHLMAGIVVRGADRSFITVPRWQSILRKCAPGCRRSEVVPVPSNVASSADADAVARLRSGFVNDPDAPIVGHFGTWGEAITALLEPLAVALLEATHDLVFVAVGRSSEVWLARFAARYPHLADRTHATGSVSPDHVAEYLLVCDLLIQPYPDGISCRRTTAMAGIALGRPVVTNSGPATEPIWSDESLVVLANASDTRAMEQAIVDLLGDPAERTALGKRAETGYSLHFGIERTLQILRAEPR